MPDRRSRVAQEQPANRLASGACAFWLFRLAIVTVCVSTAASASGPAKGKYSVRPDSTSRAAWKPEHPSDILCSTIRVGEVESLVVQSTRTAVSEVHVTSLVFFVAVVTTAARNQQSSALLVPDYFSIDPSRIVSTGQTRWAYTGAEGTRNLGAVNRFRSIAADSLQRSGVKYEFLGARRNVRVRYNDAAGDPDSAFFSDEALDGRSGTLGRTPSGYWLHAEEVARRLAAGAGVLDLRTPADSGVVRRFCADALFLSRFRWLYR